MFISTRHSRHDKNGHTFRNNVHALFRIWNMQLFLNYRKMLIFFINALHVISYKQERRRWYRWEETWLPHWSCETSHRPLCVPWFYVWGEEWSWVVRVDSRKWTTVTVCEAEVARLPEWCDTLKRIVGTIHWAWWIRPLCRNWLGTNIRKKSNKYSEGCCIVSPLRIEFLTVEDWKVEDKMNKIIRLLWIEFSSQA